MNATQLEIPDDDNRTKLRMALPQFVLRGVSGSTFGKTFPLYGSTVIGRAKDCDLSVEEEEVSRKHARITVSPSGLMVEDLGSSNGTFVNSRRIQSGPLAPGDELRIDNLRFLVQAPGMQTPLAAPTAVQESGSAMTKWVVMATALLTVVVAGFFVLDMI